jgi:hypothetical protein
MRSRNRRNAIMSLNLNVEAIQKQDTLFPSKNPENRWRFWNFSVAYNVLKRATHAFPHPFSSATCLPIMPLLSGTFASSNLTEILRVLTNAKHTGYLKMKEGGQEGCLAVETGIILHARAGTDTGLHALFQFVGWREGRFEFHERPMPPDLLRDLAVYDPEVLITGVAFKVDELTLLHEAIPSLDSILCYVGGEGLGSVEVTSADLGLLALADGHRTVREIAERVNQGPMEVARHLAKFRLAGVLELATPPEPPVKSAMAAAG